MTDYHNIEILRLDIEGTDHRIKRIEVDPRTDNGLDFVHRAILDLFKSREITCEDALLAQRTISTTYDHYIQKLAEKLGKDVSEKLYKERLNEDN